MLWDVFCRVIDNFGDVGVCWRLAVNLAGRGEEVRLWLDDASALNWMAPQVRWAQDARCGLHTGTGQPGVSVMHWRDAERTDALTGLQAGDVVVEAFGCDPPDAFVALMQDRAQNGAPPRWVNLEYLSAETYVERSHGLISPIWHGPGAGLKKRFFYPGFTPATGGLLREPGLLDAVQGEAGAEALRATTLARLGVAIQPGDKVVLVFCYPSAPLGALLDRLTAHPGADTVHVLLTPGAATDLARAWLALAGASKAAGPGMPTLLGQHGNLRLHDLPALPQPDFDRLLWCADLNFVRGEDSAVRALWAGRPHVWQIYEQDDGVHADKLDAFIQRWMNASPPWPGDLAEEVRAWWLAWNGLSTPAGALPHTLPAWQGNNTPWAQASRASRDALAAQTDLCSQLLDFVKSSG